MHQVTAVQKAQPAYSSLANLALVVIVDEKFIHAFESLDCSPVRMWPDASLATEPCAGRGRMVQPGHIQPASD
jgi:hypothetical protein